MGNNLVETHEEMIESVKTAQYLHMDETPYPIAEKCGGKRGYIWTLIGISAEPGQDIVLIYATMSRSKEALKAIDPPLWIAITCDGYAVYNMFKILQRCWIHILLVAKNLAREHGEETKEFVTMYENLLDIYDNAKTNRRKSYDQPALDTKPMISEINALAARYDTYEQGQKFATTLSNASEDLTTFVNRPGMDPSNNVAERSLRKVVIARKIRFRLVSTTGAETFARILSCTMMWRRQGLNIHDMLMKALCGT